MERAPDQGAGARDAREGKDVTGPPEGCDSSAVAGPAPVAQPPAEDVEVPPAVRVLAGDEPIRPVWLNLLGGLTFEVGTGERRRFVKWQPAGTAVDLTAEAVRLRWAAPHLTVPRVIGQGADDAGSWLVTTALPGTSAVSPRWRSDPATAVRGIGAGLRILHDRLPVEGCPFTWSVPDRLAAKRATASRRQTRRRLDALAVPPPVDRLVVCHGDACAPNTLLDDEGRPSGHVDLGRLGLADRWADLAVASWSTEWNYGPAWADALVEAYGLAPDRGRLAYYRALWAAED